MTGSEARLGRLWIPVALLAALTFANALQNDLVYDANFLVRKNATLREARETGGIAGIIKLTDVFREGFWDGVNETRPAALKVLGQALYRPLMLFTLGSLYVTVGDVPAVYHALNILYHVLSAILVALLALRLANNRTVALAAGLLFAAHPIHSEAVSYVAGIGETQATAFALLSILLYLDATAGERTRRGRLALSTLSFAVALFTKESAAIAIVLVFLLDLARGERAPAWRRRLLLYAPFAAVIAVNIAVRYRVCGHLAPDPNLISFLDNPLIKEGFMVRLATGVMLFAKAIHLFLLPWGQSADYSFDQLPVARSLAEPASWSGFLLCATLTIAGLVWLRRRPVVGFGLLAFLFAYGPMSNIPVAIGTIFGERLLYLPSVGLSLAAGALVAALIQEAKRRGEVPGRVARSVSIAVLLVLSFLTAIRNRAYLDDKTLFADMIETAPRSARAWYGHGEDQRVRYYLGEDGDLLRAIADFKEARRIYPDYHLAWMGLARAYAMNGEYQAALDTLETLRNAIPEDSGWDEFRRDVEAQMTQIYARMTSESGDPQERLETLNKLIAMLEEQYERDPDNTTFLSELVDMYLMVNRIEDARRLLEPAVLAMPDSPVLQGQIVQVYAKSGEIERARTVLPKLREHSDREAKKLGLLYSGILAWNDGGQAREAGDEAAAMEHFRQGKEWLDEYIEMVEAQPSVSPQEAAGYFARAQILHDGFRDFEAAIQDYGNTVRVNPGHVDAPYRIAECLVAMKKFTEQTEKFFDDLRKAYPDNGHLLFGNARLLEGLGKHLEAAELVKQAIDVGLNSVLAHSYRAKLLTDGGEPERALEALDEAHELLPVEHPELLNLRGAALFELERYDEALEAFREMETLARSSPEFAGHVPQALFQQAKTMLRLPDLAEEGFARLQQLEVQLANASRAAAEEDRKGLLTMRAYVFRQLAWGRLNVPALMDPEGAVRDLETARSICESEELDEIVANDILADLADAYLAAGRPDDAARIQESLEAAEADDAAGAADTKGAGAGG